MSTNSGTSKNLFSGLWKFSFIDNSPFILSLCESSVTGLPAPVDTSYWAIDIYCPLSTFLTNCTIREQLHADIYINLLFLFYYYFISSLL